MKQNELWCTAGTGLGPFFFIVYVNAIVKLDGNATFTLYASDTSLFSSGRDANDIAKWAEQKSISRSPARNFPSRLWEGGKKRTIPLMTLQLQITLRVTNYVPVCAASMYALNHDNQPFRYFADINV